MVNILIHGLGQTPASWNKTIEELAPLEHFHCPDLCGLLKKKEVNYSTLYAAFSEYCDKLEEPANLCGLSLGAVLALNYAIEHPAKVHSLVLIAAQYQMPKNLLKFQNFMFRFMPSKLFEEAGFGKQDFIALSKSMAEIDFSADLHRITCPVLLLCGEKDRVNRRASLKLKDYIDNSSFKMIENASHEVNLDNPKQLGALLRDFLR